MDMDSPEKAMEGIKAEDGSSFVENPDPNLFETKDYQTDENFMHESAVNNDAMQVYLDQGYPVSPVMHIENEGLQSPIMKPNSAGMSSAAKNNRESFLPIQSDLSQDDMGRRFFDYGTEERRFSVEDYQSNDKKETEDADHIPQHGDFLDDNNVNATYNNEFHTEDSYSLAHNSLLTGDNNNSYEIVGDEAFNCHQIGKSPVLDEAEDGGVENAFTSFHSEKPEVHAEIDAGNMIPHVETKHDYYSSVQPASENGGMVWDNSSLHSRQRTQNASPSPERQFSVSAERSSHSQQPPLTHASPRHERVPSPANIDKKSAPSPSSTRRKRSPSVEKHSGGRRRNSPSNHSSPARQKSPSERATKLDHHKDRDGSPKRHVAPSRRRDSPRRRGRSTSHSPVRRDSYGHRRDHQRRSRSRSPHPKDRYRRSPRRRPSPRRRSPPPSYSHRRSPRRPWSPPANRNTGLGKPGNNLFVAGFSYATTERDLEKKFSKFGRVTDVRIVRDRRSGESRGFGFLSLERDEDADAAIRAVDQTEWNGRIVLVEKSKTATR